MKLCFLDAEFNGVSERVLNLVSIASVTTVDGVEDRRESFWLHGRKYSAAAKYYRNLIAEGYTFVAYAAEAETRTLLSLFGEDRTWLKDFKVIDLYLEYRCLLNHNNQLAYGEQYMGGKVITTKPPKSKWAVQKTGDDDSHNKPSYSLAAATFKLLKTKIDTAEKNEVRDIIIRGNKAEIYGAADRIMKYNESDIEYLPRLLGRVAFIFTKHFGFPLEQWRGHALARGDYARRTALMVEAGYPINMEKVNKFTANITEILKSAAEDCIEAEEKVTPFIFNKRSGRYVLTEKRVRDWISSQAKPYWRKTDKGQLSLSKDAFKDWYDSESPGFGGAFCRYLKTKQSLNGFLPGSGKKGVFKDYVGQDNRSRPYFGIYGSQSSRSQPAATGFIPLKAHWMRNFIEAAPGRALCGIDFASQEFLIAAILSQDKKMMAAYASGDVYLAFAKAAKLVPPDATKQSHKIMRDACKTIILGISYDMSAKGLAPRIQQSGVECDEGKAQGYIDKFFETYDDYSQWKTDTIRDYDEDGKLMLPDGWTMWGNNNNYRSVGNFPVQGTGAVIMRESVRRAQDSGLDIVFTLHDALYCEFDSYDTSAIKTLMKCMAEGFEAVMSKYGKTVPIRLDGEAWSTDYRTKMPTEEIDGVPYLTEYTDAKGEKDLARYRKFFTG